MRTEVALLDFLKVARFSLRLVSKSTPLLTKRCNSTHSTKNCESQLKKECGSLISFSHGTSNVRGVAVFFKSNLDIVFMQELSDCKGRLLERFSVECRKQFRVCFGFALLRPVIG